VPGPAGLLPDLHLFASLISSLGEHKQSADLAEVWKEIGKPSTSVFKGLTFSRISNEGIQLDGSKWDSLSFVEKDALHFTPTPQLQEA
jgi:hypothetical protein